MEAMKGDWKLETSENFEELMKELRGWHEDRCQGRKCRISPYLLFDQLNTCFVQEFI